MSRKDKIFDWSKRFPHSDFRWAIVTQSKSGASYAACVCQQRSVARLLCAALNIKEARPTVRAKRPVQQAKHAIDYGEGHCPRCGYYLKAGS